MAAFIADCRFASEMGATLFCEEGILALEGISLRDERNLNLHAELWQALE
jgi:hypothetical protein